MATVFFFVIYSRYHKKVYQDKLAKQNYKEKIAREWLDNLTKEYIFLGTDAWTSAYEYLTILASYCKRNSTSILLPGIQFNELESAKDKNEDVLRIVSDLLSKKLIRIEGMNYSHSFSTPNDTIEALVKFAEKAISKRARFTFITDAPSLIVRLKCFQNDEFVHIVSIEEVRSRIENSTEWRKYLKKTLEDLVEDE